MWRQMDQKLGQFWSNRSKIGQEYIVKRDFHYENKFTKTFRPTNILHIFTKGAFTYEVGFLGR